MDNANSTELSAKSFVSYEDFGAVGDGKTDDFAAIRKAHAYANANDRSVKADPGATYYIGHATETAEIMTNTDWGTARFIFDDTKVPVDERNHHVFAVKSKLVPVDLPLPGSIEKGRQYIDVGGLLSQNALVVALNSEKKQFMRKGLNVNDGMDQIDCFVVDQSGAVLTPVIWDFDHVSSLKAYPIDEIPLLLSGGIFTTISTTHSQEVGYTYFARGISFTRSNVVVTGIKHGVTGEPEPPASGSPYGGFVSTQSCAYMQFRDCHFFGHKIYSVIGSANLPVSMGTYDINLNRTVDVSFTNCRQDNIMDVTRWGVIGSNACKNVLLDGCVFSRIDAHMNVANLTVRNTTLGWQGFNAIGHGRLTVENVTHMGPCVVNLRSDYGSSWDGDLFIKNVTWYPSKSAAAKPAVIVANNSGGHDFGYPCSFPRKVAIENLRVMDVQHGNAHECVSIFGGIDESNGELSGFSEPAAGDFPLLFAERLEASGLSTQSGKGFRLWSGDVNRCYCRNAHAFDRDGGLWPNFRAKISDADRFVYDMSGCAAPGGTHNLVPDIEVKDCARVTLRAGSRPARVRVRDCAIETETNDFGGAAVVACERVRNI